MSLPNSLPPPPGASGQPLEGGTFEQPVFSPVLAPEEHLRQTWSRFVATSRAQLKQLQQTTLMLFYEKGSQQRAEAAEVARSLADACEAFRLPEVVRLARQFQLRLGHGAPPGALAQLLVRLSYELERGSLASFPVTRASQPHLWLYSNESELQDRLTAAATARGFQVRSLHYAEALDPTYKLDLLQPDLLVLVIAHPEDLRSLRALRSRFPQIPIAVISSQESFALRLESARVGVAAVLLRDDPLDQLFELLDRALVAPLQPMVTEEPGPSGRPASKGKVLTLGPSLRSRVLVAGDDASTREMAEAALRHEGFEVAALDNAPALLETLDNFNPELVIFDFFPHERGVELCRILRSHPRWASLSIIMVTYSEDAHTASLVLNSGADNFISKPLTGPELVARVANRLQRALSHRLHGDIDRFTGLCGKHEALRTFVFMTRIAERHGVPVSFSLIRLETAGNLDEGMRQLSLQVRKDMRRVTDQLARWSSDILAVALYDTSRIDSHELLQRLIQRSQPLGSLRASLATFPADGIEAVNLFQDLEGAVAAAPVGSVRSLGSLTQRDDLVAWLKNPFLELSQWDTFFKRRGRTIQWLTQVDRAEEVLFGGDPDKVPQVLCLDLDVDFMDGFETLRRLARSPMRVIALCADDVKEIFRAQEAGAFDVLTRPVDLELLSLRLGRALGD